MCLWQIFRIFFLRNLKAWFGARVPPACYFISEVISFHCNGKLVQQRLFQITNNMKYFAQKKEAKTKIWPTKEYLVLYFFPPWIDISFCFSCSCRILVHPPILICNCDTVSWLLVKPDEKRANIYIFGILK